MRIATFNINGIKARLPRLLDWLDEARPDVALLQELKSVDEGVPHEPFEERGYSIATHGQKSFNGVAVLARLGLEDVVCGLPGDPEDVQARWIEATIPGGKVPVRVCGLYLPNGNPAPGPKFDYKLAWMARMETRVRELLALEEVTVFAGDYNVIPQRADVARPDAWGEDALFRPESRAAFFRMLHLGLTDAIRARHPEPGLYTFWDYQARAWERDDGIRIDHILLSPQAADLMVDCGIDRVQRELEKPSDHVPVWVELDI
ncbi:MAG: exodeoxyribonuclease III [Rhodobacteraceae bacterium]|nr:exodeoxyribonuclease III [Paracoccaceae bacterium]